MSRLVYLDQNAWVALGKGAWDKEAYPREHEALVKVVESTTTGEYEIPLSSTNIYETSKINDPVKRANLARTQALISGGQVFRGRRRILRETLTKYVAERFAVSYRLPDGQWFLSKLWFEAVGDYDPETYGFDLPDHFLDGIRANPAWTLFKYLAFGDDGKRVESVRRYSASSAELIERIEARRSLSADAPFALRKRAYGASMIIDELDFIFEIGQNLGLHWQSVGDIGSSLIRSMVVDVPIFNVERELVVRLENESRLVHENDLRDMMAFMTVLPLADVVVAEKPFVNLARQAKLGDVYETKLLTNVFDL